jgi:peptidyl-prolyl cis-trans isomerase SurA
MRLRIILALGLGVLLHGAVVLDRVAVAVGRHAVKASDIGRELRVTAFLNRQPLDTSPQARRKAADRLVDQELIGLEVANGGYTPVTNADADRLSGDLRRDRFGNSDQRLRSELSRYGITEQELRRELMWQLTVLRFIDQRFRLGVLVTDEDVRAYYDAHRADLRRAYPKDSRLTTLEPTIRQSLEGERINQAFDEWLKQVRQRTRIEYHEEAFHDQPS